MSDLVTFLLARYDDAERAVVHWDSDARAKVASMWTGGDPGYTTVATSDDDESWIAGGEEVDSPRHVRVLFDPQVALRDIRAKRILVRDCSRTLSPDPLRSGDYWRGARDGADGHLRMLAVAFEDHPDYEPRWAPESVNS